MLEVAGTSTARSPNPQMEKQVESSSTTAASILEAIIAPVSETIAVAPVLPQGDDEEEDLLLGKPEIPIRPSTM